MSRSRSWSRRSRPWLQPWCWQLQIMTIMLAVWSAVVKFAETNNTSSDASEATVFPLNVNVWWIVVVIARRKLWAVTCMRFSSILYLMDHKGHFSLRVNHQPKNQFAMIVPSICPFPVSMPGDMTCLGRNIAWIPWNLSFHYIHCTGQFTPKMKANAEPHLLSSLVWIDSGVVVPQHHL